MTVPTLPSKVWTLAEVAQAEMARLRTDRRPTGLPSGLGLERRVPGGISRDKVTTLFAESGSYKSTIVGTMQMAMARAGHRVMSVSLEDSKELAAHRLLAIESGLAYGDISGGAITAADAATLGMSEDLEAAASRIWIVDDVEPLIESILSLALGAKRTKGLDCLFIDYLQLLDGPGDEKHVITKAVKAGSRFAKDHKVGVVFVSQQKQGRERDTDDPRPKIGDLFGSSAMRMQSKLLLGLFCPFNYQPAPSNRGLWAPYARFLSANPDHAHIYPGILELWPLKNVLGRRDPIHLYVEAKTGVVVNADQLMAPYL